MHCYTLYAYVIHSLINNVLNIQRVVVLYSGMYASDGSVLLGPVPCSIYQCVVSHRMAQYCVFVNGLMQLLSRQVLFCVQQTSHNKSD